jgi:deazaflavin-dependent oxidoreductase (nitroreductase family)
MSDGAPHDPNAFNTKIIDEFRSTGGRPGGRFEGVPLLILHTTGAKSGEERLNPLAYQEVGDHWAVFASKAGATTDPDWFHNVVADPRVSIEVGTDTGTATVDVVAHVVRGDERTEIWENQKAKYPHFAEYEQTAGDREIPVVVLERA